MFQVLCGTRGHRVTEPCSSPRHTVPFSIYYPAHTQEGSEGYTRTMRSSYTEAGLPLGLSPHLSPAPGACTPGSRGGLGQGRSLTSVISLPPRSAQHTLALERNHSSLITPRSCLRRKIEHEIGKLHGNSKMKATHDPKSRERKQT